MVGALYVMVAVAIFVGCSRSIDGDLQDVQLDTTGEVKIGYFPGLNGPFQISYLQVADKAVVGGDMVFDLKQVNADGLNLAFYGRTQLWPNGVIPYDYEPGYPFQEMTENMVSLVNSTTILRWVRRTNEPDYVHFTHIPFASTSACGQSLLGRTGGRQPLWIRCNNQRVQLHEMMHAAGLAHEHQRTDRAQYVDAIGPGCNSVNIEPSIPGYGNYDPDSIMHYYLVSILN